jgi:oxygen-independent coproporphyrinogen III oxidase
MVASHEVAVPGSEADAALYEQTMETLLRNGFEQYEVSNFARGGARSRHNLGYWDHSNYLAFGPSAHGFWVDRRWWNIAQLQTYCERLERSQLPVAGEERLRPLQLAEEAVFLGLRSDGIDLARFAARFGRDLQERNAPLIERLISDGLAVEEKGRLRLTARGYLLCDEICQSFR